MGLTDFKEGQSRGLGLIGCDQGHMTRDPFSLQCKEKIMMIPSVMWVATHSGGFLRASPHLTNHSLVQRRLLGEAGNEQALWRVSGAVEMPPALVQAARTPQ